MGCAPCVALALPLLIIAVALRLLILAMLVTMTIITARFIARLSPCFGARWLGAGFITTYLALVIAIFVTITAAITATAVIAIMAATRRMLAAFVTTRGGSSGGLAVDLVGLDLTSATKEKTPDSHENADFFHCHRHWCYGFAGNRCGGGG